MCCPLRQRWKLGVAENLIDQVIISETLLKGKESLIENTSKCLNDLNEIWFNFPDSDTRSFHTLLGQSTTEHIYQCTKVIGSPGAYGIVKKAIHKETGEEVAIKHINKRRYKKRESQRTYFNDLRSEVYLMQKASDHPHIANIYHVFEDIETLYLVLEYCQGGELYDVLTENRKQFNEKTAADIFRQMVASIYYLHSLGIAHCDLKPENFVFKDKERKQLILIDFGMAKIIEFRKYFKCVAGSPLYVAPEVLRNNYNEACDIWSLGVCLFVIIFGYAPFFDRKGTGENCVYKKILHGFTPSVKEGYGAWFPESIPVSSTCRDLIGKMLRTNYADRLTGEEVLEHPWLQNDAISRAQTSSESEVKLVQILNPAILNSLRSYNTKKKTVLHEQVLKLITECHYLNSNQMHSLKEFLLAADANQDQQISKQELLDVLQTIDDGITMKDVESIFTAVDANADGYLTYEELVTIRINRKLNSKESRLEKVFKSFDYDGNGLIDYHELEAVWVSVLGESARSNDFKQIIKEIDKNGDGKIDYEEFLDAFGRSRNNSESTIVVKSIAL